MSELDTTMSGNEVVEMSGNHLNQLLIQEANTQLRNEMNDYIKDYILDFDIDVAIRRAEDL